MSDGVLLVSRCLKYVQMHYVQIFRSRQTVGMLNLYAMVELLGGELEIGC